MEKEYFVHESSYIDDDVQIRQDKNKVFLLYSKRVEEENKK